MGMGALSAVTG